MQLTLKAARKKKRLSLAALAEKARVNKSTINRLERGETQPLHDTVTALEDALKLKRGSLVFPDQREAMSA